MKRVFKRFLVVAFVVITMTLLMSATMEGCSDAQIVSQNLSTAADQFEIYRRVVFYNGITDTYMLSVEGFCSIEKDNMDNQLELTVKIGPNNYFKHFLGLSDNVTYFVEQLDGADVSPNFYRVIFKPTTIIPMIDLAVTRE